MEYMICFLGGAHSLLPRMWAEDCRSNSLVKVKNNHEHQTVLVRLNKPTHFLLRLADDLHPHTHTHTHPHTPSHTHTHTHTHTLTVVTDFCKSSSLWREARNSVGT